MAKEYCICSTHNTQQLNWCRKKSWIAKLDFADDNMAHFATRGNKALKESWATTFSRCACCGKDGTDAGTVMTHGADEQDTPNGECAVCYYCRDQIHNHMEENTPQALCGRGAGVTETTEWNALLKLAQEIGSGAKPIKGWTPARTRAERRHV